MKALIHRRYIVKQNLLAIIGLCLCVYFSYHAILGQRSYVRLMVLDHEIETLETQYEALHHTRTGLESKVTMLRPGSLDPDLLEERARYVLGHMRPDEQLVLGTN